jgi:O-antigen/teichoic acid export membrane protein
MLNIKTKIDDLASRQGFMRYFKNTSWLMGERILRMAVGLFVGIWVARYLGPERFGLFSYAQSFVGLFMAIATLGLDGIVVRELVKDQSKQDALLGTAFILKLIGAFIVLLLLFFTVNIISKDAQTKLLIIVIASATIFQSMNVVDFYFQSKVLSRYVAFANMFTLLISSAVKVWLILNDASLIAFAWVVLFDSAILSLGYIYVYLKTGNSIKQWSFDKALAQSLLKDSWPLILSGIVVSVYMKIDQVMIKEMLGAEAVGQYAAAVRLSEAWYFIPMVISSSLFPAILDAKKLSERLYFERLQKLYCLVVWMAIVIALLVTFSSDWVVSLLYGGQYNQAAGVLAIHIWTGIFVFLGVVKNKFMLAENVQYLGYRYSSIGASINIVLNYYGIMYYGIIGAAISTLITQFLSAYILPYGHKTDRKSSFIFNKVLLGPIYALGLNKGKK